jgi:large subunit ribosomal protein L17
MAMLRNLSTAFFDKERIRTTLPKAKELRPFVERLITLAKRDTLHARRLASRSIRDKAVLKKLFATLGPRFAQRPGGYSRILKLGWREGDGAEVAILELLGSEPKFEKAKPKGRKKPRKKEEPAEETAEAAAAEPAPEPGSEPPEGRPTRRKGSARPAGKRKGKTPEE